VTQFHGKENLYTRLLRHVDFYIMPVMNVDGYDYTWKKVGVAKRAKYAPWDGCIHGIPGLGEEVLLWKRKSVQ
jgi:hypothetical protein